MNHADDPGGVALRHNLLHTTKAARHETDDPRLVPVLLA